MKKSHLTGLALVSGLLFASCQQTQTQEVNTHNRDTTSSQVEANKKLVLDFYQQMFGDKDTSAVDKYILPSYIQHNPTVADGSQAFKLAAAEWFKGAPKSKIDVQRIAAEKDLVFLHIKNQGPDGQFISTVDIFRIENGKIAEHWDVHQEVPKEAANAHPMF